MWRLKQGWVRLLSLSGWLWRKKLTGGVASLKPMRKPDREAFDELMGMCRTYASESSCATNPIIFEPMVMSILVGQQKKFRKLDYKLNDVIWQEICAGKITQQSPTNL